MSFTIGAPANLLVQAAKHVRPKGAKHLAKTRPIKHTPSDKNRKPVVYPMVKAEDIPPLMTVLK
eukprot:CAMPEP_0197589892 /NCGR_PEP_ID=MMETSP1326-20131121/10677_1 /TAXON_ID=1155430 /ORGANISM="Genus nov. species nov., Strain RCC2288" /LENGTH=63 /DNA_ID=CAMNT_0043154875 /DNA_START=33 /DNA_END=224 /DNA_ORIENTATION=-